MQIPGSNGSKQIRLICIALLVQAFLIYVVIYLTVIWSGENKCLNVFQRPHEHHRIRIRPLKHIFPMDELEPNDSQKLIDLTNFTFINRNEASCADSDVFLLVLIPSAPNNELKRRTIRETWGSQNADVKIFFMLGLSESNETEKAVENESQMHRDIVQGNFLDTYKNITYKTVMSLKYVLYNCPQATYVLKVDDDSFVNVALLKNFLKHDLSPYGAENLFLCNDMTGSLALRDPNSKWFVPVEDFPDKFYPSYCSGWYAIFSSDICFKLYKESQKLKYLFIEDAFVYGIAAAKANVTHVDFSYHTLAYRKIEGLFNNEYQDVPILFGFPNMGPDMINKFYEYFKNKDVPQSIHKPLGRY